MSAAQQVNAAYRLWEEAAKRETAAAIESGKARREFEYWTDMLAKQVLGELAAQVSA